MSYSMNNESVFARQNDISLRTVLIMTEILLGLGLLFVSFSTSDYTFLTILSLILFINGLLIIYHKTKQLISISSIFYILVFLFHLSYFFFILANNVVGNVHLFASLSTETQIKTLKFCIVFLSSFPLGAVFCANKNSLKIKPFMNKNQIYKIGLIIFLACLLPRLYVDITTFRLYLSGGYLNTFKVSFNNYVTIFANMFYFGCLLTIYGCNKNEKKGSYFFLVFLMIIIIGMLGGRRSVKVVYLVSVAYVYLKYYKSVSFLKTVLFFLLGYLFLALIAAFGDVRGSGQFNISTLFNSFMNNLSLGLISDQLSEFGYAAYTLAASIEYFPTSSYGYGFNYFASWLEILPNVGGFLTGFSNSMSFVLKLPRVYQHALGGSMLGEAFYNFGNYSFIFFVFIGYLFTFAHFILDYCSRKNYLSFGGLLVLISLSSSFMWVRSVFNEFPRTIVWTLITVWVLKSIMFKKAEYTDV